MEALQQKHYSNVAAEQTAAGYTAGILPQATVAALGTTTNLTAVPGSFADLAAVQTYLVTLRANTEARLDAIEAKVDEILASVKSAGIIAT